MRGFVSAFAAVALLLGACGDGDEAESSTPSTAASSAPAQDDDGAGDDPIAASGSDEFQALLERARNSTYTVSYEYLDQGGGQGEQFTVTHDATGTAIVQPDGQLLIEDATGLIVCDDSSCTRVGQGMSMDLMLQGLLGPFAALMDADASTGIFTGIDIDITTETIVGRSAKCVTIDPSRIAAMAGAPSDAELVSCADEETGVMLRTRVTGEGETGGLEATSFSTTADASLLTPPFEPQSPGAG